MVGPDWPGKLGRSGPGGTLEAVKNHLRAYEVIASIVGVLLIVLCLIGFPLNHWGSGDAKEVGSWISTNLGVAHGWLYMIYLFITFILARRAKWDLNFTIVTLICGTIPILSFWAELRVVRKMRDVA